MSQLVDEALMSSACGSYQELHAAIPRELCTIRCQSHGQLAGLDDMAVKCVFVVCG